MRICFFGTYNVEEGYPRVRVLLEGLRRGGHQVDQCRLPFLSDAASKLEGAANPLRAVRLAFGLLLIQVRLAWRFLVRTPRPDMLLVGYPGQLDVFVARLLATIRGVPLVFDAFVSLYDTMVDDRKLVRPGSPRAWALRSIDRTTCLLADAVLLDTAAHIDYFVHRLNLPREKFIRVLIGEDDRIFSGGGGPLTGRGDRLEVLYFGSYIPLHGLATILGAARLLEEDPEKDRLRLTVCGRGQLSPELRRSHPPDSLPGVRFIHDWLPYDSLIRLIGEADICLGIFGTTDKARRVIPLKVYASLAMGKAVVTGDTPGARELLRDGETALLVPPGDPRALVDALHRLAADRELVQRLGRSAESLFRERLAPERIAGHMIDDLARMGITSR